MKFIVLGFVIGIALWLPFGLVDLYQRRNRRAIPIRHRRRHQWEGRTTVVGQTGGYDGRDRSGDDWGSGTWDSSDQGSADGGGGSDGGGGGGSD